MKVKVFKCKDCGYEKKIEIYTDEEVVKYRIPVGPVTKICPKCRSKNTELRG